MFGSKCEWPGCNLKKYSVGERSYRFCVQHKDDWIDDNEKWWKDYDRFGRNSRDHIGPPDYRPKV